MPSKSWLLYLNISARPKWAYRFYSVTGTIALRAGELDGHNQARGIRVPLADLLIGVTALELGYGVATWNLRHFKQVPGLSVSQF